MKYITVLLGELEDIFNISTRIILVL